MDIITKIVDAIQSDEIVRDDLSLEIIKEYNSLSTEAKKAVDRIFIHLTGYSLNTLINSEDSKYNPFV